MYSIRWLLLIGLIASGIVPKATLAGDLTDIFSNELGGLELEPLGEALADTVAAFYPVASASSSVTYSFNPELQSYERQTRVLGPIFGERAESIGSGEMDVSITYSYVDLKQAFGADLDSLQNKKSIGGRVVSIPNDGVQLGDPDEEGNGRFTNFLPALVNASLDVEAHIISPGVTYGLTPDLDVNVTLPLVRTSLKGRVTGKFPDPRLEQFRVKNQDDEGTISGASSNSSFDVGDILFRFKYVLLRNSAIDMAMQAGLILPSGDPNQLQGTGDTRLPLSIIGSRVFADRFEVYGNLGIDINANDVERSIAKWTIGSTARLFGGLHGSLVFLGRHELSEQTDKIDAPFFLQIERSDIFDVGIGLRYLLAEQFVITANVLLPLNDDGLRADAIPTVQLEYSFPTR